jgi:hypothetical protein
LTDFIPLKGHKEKKARRKKKEKRKHDDSEDKILVFCKHQRPFFACYHELYPKVWDKVSRMYCARYPNCSSCEDDSFKIAEETGVLYPTCLYEHWIDEVVTATIETSDEELKRTCGVKSRSLVWRKEKSIFSKCRCKAIRISDDEIIEREALTEMAEFEPCTFRCNELQEKGMCLFMERKKEEEKTAQRVLVRYFPRERTMPDQHVSKQPD